MFQNKDILFCIFSNIRSPRELLRLQILSKFVNDVIRDTTWDNIFIDEKIAISMRLLSNFKFTNYKITRQHGHPELPDCILLKFLNCKTVMLYDYRDIDYIIPYLRNCNRVTLFGSTFSYKILESLDNCSKLDLSLSTIKDMEDGEPLKCETIKVHQCKLAVSEQHFHMLSMCHQIDLFRTTITDVGISKLTNVRNLRVAFCKKIIGTSFVTLANLVALKCSYTGVVDDSIKYLTNLVNLNVSGCSAITNNGIRSLVQLKRLSASGCKKITDDGIKHLINVRWFNLSKTNITNASGYLFKECYHVEISETRVTNKILKYLSNCDVITVSRINVNDNGVRTINPKYFIAIGCHNLTKNAFDHMKNVTVMVCTCVTYPIDTLKVNDVTVKYVQCKCLKKTTMIA